MTTYGVVPTFRKVLHRCGVSRSTPCGRLTNSPAWQEVAPYSSRRHSQDFGPLWPRDFAKLNLQIAISDLMDQRSG